MKLTTNEKIKQRAKELKMQACNNRDTEDFLKEATHQIKAEEKIEQKIQRRAEKLRLQSLEYHDFEYYRRLAEYQIKIEQDEINKHQLYDPRRWINSLDYRCLKVWATQLRKCSFLNILEQIAVLSILVGTITFLTEEKSRYHEQIRELRKNLAEVTELETPQEILINTYLTDLNYRRISVAQIFNFSGLIELIGNTFKGEKVYVLDRKIGKCKKIPEIALVFPRWPQANLYNLHLPEDKNIKLNGLTLCGANMPQAVLNNIELYKAELPGAYLFEAELKGSKLAKANLESANLESADLRNADLTGANLTAANLIGTKLNEIEVNNLTKSQLKLACNWDKANYIYRQTQDEKWEVDTQANQRYIEEEIRNNQASDPQTPVDCSQWN